LRKLQALRLHSNQIRSCPIVNQMYSLKVRFLYLVEFASNTNYLFRFLISRTTNWSKWILPGWLHLGSSAWTSAATTGCTLTQDISTITGFSQNPFPHRFISKNINFLKDQKDQ
jgi:hypothetical protein